MGCGYVILLYVPTTVMCLLSVALLSIPDPGMVREALHTYTPLSDVASELRLYCRVLDPEDSISCVPFGATN